MRIALQFYHQRKMTVCKTQIYLVTLNCPDEQKLRNSFYQISLLWQYSLLQLKCLSNYVLSGHMLPLLSRAQLITLILN